MPILYRQKYRQKSSLAEKHYTCFCCFLAWCGHPDIAPMCSMMAHNDDNLVLDNGKAAQASKSSS